MIKFILKKILIIYKLYKYGRNNKIEKSCIIGKKVTLNNCIFNQHSRVAEYASIHDTEVGAYSALGRYSKIVHTKIGKYCAISWNTTINAISHPHNHLTISAFPYVPRLGNFVQKRKQLYKEVIIKNDVWIGANSVIMPGITIGNGAVVGAGAVVTKDVPDYAIVVGVPAIIVKYRFSEDIIDKLLELKWWDLDSEIIKKHIDLWDSEFNYETLKKLEEICEF
ncbi:CatB-related O-acetyltransferase [Aliarcobacter butzleri]|uniref:CatB-related O-acetyltransferase n=1 Tax=Aliarcobacter butzleri TaxID=28197 RepID=UPI003B220CE1